MTADVLETINRRAALSAARAEAERAGLDAEALLDSASLHSKLIALDPDSASFPREVRELVQQTAAARGMTHTAAPAVQPSPSPAPAAGGAPRQWTDADVNNSSPAELAEALGKGLLRDLGYGPGHRRR